MFIHFSIFELFRFMDPHCNQKNNVNVIFPKENDANYTNFDALDIEKIGH